MVIIPVWENHMILLLYDNEAVYLIYLQKYSSYSMLHFALIFQSKLTYFVKIPGSGIKCATEMHWILLLTVLNLSSIFAIMDKAVLIMLYFWRLILPALIHVYSQ